MGANATSPDLGALVLSRGATVSLRRGEVLFHEGDASTSVYACHSGRLKVYVTTPSGDELVLGWKGPGDGFGELSAIDGSPRSATIVAVADARLATLGRAEFLDALRTAPDVAVAMLTELAGLLRRANLRVTVRKSERVPARVTMRLVELAAQFRRHSPGAAVVELEVTHDDLAGWVGATRESTSRALAGLRRAGLVETRRGRIVVPDPEALEASLRPG